MASLYVIRGRDLGNRFTLDADTTTIGREIQNRIQLHDTEVSRYHAKIEAKGGDFLLTDLVSSNGTIVNSQPITKQVLQNGDRLQFGSTLLIFKGNTEAKSKPELVGVDILHNDVPLEASHIRQSMTAKHSIPTGDSDWTVERPLAATGQDNPLLWEMMCQISMAVSRTLDIDRLLEQILDLVFQWIGCDRGCIMLLDNETKILQPACRKNRELRSSMNRFQISNTILDYVVQKQEGIITSNAKDDQRWETAASIVQMGIHEAICVPMQGRYGIVGAIYIDTSRSPGDYVDQGMKERFTAEHLKIMVAIGNQAALAIEDTHYYHGMVQAERLAVMGQTVATLSHHIKNILQGIQSGAYLVDEGIKKNELSLIAKGWGIVDKNQDRIASLVMDMLSFSKDRPPDLCDADLRDTIEDAVQLVQTRASEARVKIQWLRPDPFPMVRFDPEGLHRAILNIVNNAIDACATASDPTVTIRLSIEDQGKLVVIEIEDNGLGIAPEDLQKVFLAFESRKGNRGTGLGLPVSRKILREHGGDVSAESEPTVRTCFKLFWPASGQTPEDDAALPDRPTLNGT